MSLQCGIKLDQLYVNSFEVKLIKDDIIWDNEIESADININFAIVYILKFPSYGNYIRKPVFYIRSNLCSNFYVQIHINDTKTESETMSNVNIFMWNTNAFLPNLPITYADGDYKKSCCTPVLRSGSYIELVDANLHTIDLLDPLRLSLLVEFY